MEHKRIAQLQTVADVEAVGTSGTMPRELRLSRWMELLQAASERKLRSLHEIEHLHRLQQRECRADNSPLTVAYEDPLLRSGGLRGDRVGDCTDFFELSDRQMHRAFCSCHVGISLTGAQAAERLRHVLRGEDFRKRTK